MQSILLSFFLCTSTLAAQDSSEPTSSPRHPDVVVIMLDTLRPDHLGFYGYEKNTSPFLDELSQGFAVFDYAYSTSTWTAPACASLFTGHYPPAHGILEGFFAHDRREKKPETAKPKVTWRGRLPSEPNPGLEVEKKPEKEEGQAGEDGTVIRINQFSDDMKLLPEYFREAGYQTFGIATNPNIGPEIGFHRGFDEFVQIDDGDASQVLEMLGQWKSRIQTTNSPTFLYLHFMDVHKPYRGRAPWYEEKEDENEDNISRYDSELSYLDQHLETLFKEWSWDENTILVFVSDHGEEFMEHGQVGHRFSMHNELNHILLMMRGPGIEAKHTPLVAGIHDVLPTLLDLAELGSPEEGTGESLRGYLARDPLPKEELKQAEERIIYAHRAKFRPRQTHVWGANYKNWRFIQDAGSWELYDILEDPLETINLMSRFPVINTKLRSSLKKFRQLGFGSRAKQTEITLDADAMSLLNALGYVGPSLEEEPEKE